MHHTPQEINKFWDKKINPLDNIKIKIHPIFFLWQFYHSWNFI